MTASLTVRFFLLLCLYRAGYRVAGASPCNHLEVQNVCISILFSHLKPTELTELRRYLPNKLVANEDPASGEMSGCQGTEIGALKGWRSPWAERPPSLVADGCRQLLSSCSGDLKCSMMPVSSWMGLTAWTWRRVAQALRSRRCCFLKTPEHGSRRTAMRSR
jgi:hypothetical protein